MKLQGASRREITRISIGILVCDGILVTGLWLLSRLGMGRFQLAPILLSAAGGSVVAIANFTLLCLTVQSAVAMESERNRRIRFQLSYNLRLFLQAAWVVACFAVKPIHFIAGAAPILFPNAVIFYLRRAGNLYPAPSAFPDVEDPSNNFEMR